MNLSLQSALLPEMRHNFLRVVIMDRDVPSSMVLEALVTELAHQGQGGLPDGQPARLVRYPIKGTIDVVALAEAVENALGGGTSHQQEDGKAPAELNAANDG